jgi:hypothetical protein
MPAPLIDLLRAGVPALLCLVVGIVVIRIVCRRPALRRLSFALSLIALTASVALFRTLVPAEATLLDPYLVLFRDAVQVAKDARAAEVARIGALLAGVEFLEALTSEQVERLASQARIVPFPKGGTVEGPGDDRAGQLLGRMRRFFGLMGGE